MANRYALRMEHPHSWTVFDGFTGQPVELKHQVLVGMNTRDADAMVGSAEQPRCQATGKGGEQALILPLGSLGTFVRLDRIWRVGPERDDVRDLTKIGRRQHIYALAGPVIGIPGDVVDGAGSRVEGGEIGGFCSWCP